jgi:hypothetical protein
VYFGIEASFIAARAEFISFMLTTVEPLLCWRGAAEVSTSQATVISSERVQIFAVLLNIPTKLNACKLPRTASGQLSKGQGIPIFTEQVKEL